MKIAVVQFRPVAGDIEQNIALHLMWLRLAATRSVNLVCFPELSLTGYEPALAESLSLAADDARLRVFDEFCLGHQLHAGIGLPLTSRQGVQIAQVYFGADGVRRPYAKQYLHADEQSFFVRGSRAMRIGISDDCIVPAICYEALLQDKVQQAVSMKASVYLASVAKSVDDVDRAHGFFSATARQHGLWVLMSNAVGPCDNFVAAGGTGVWRPDGRALAILGKGAMGMIIIDTVTGETELIDVNGVSEEAHNDKTMR